VTSIPLNKRDFSQLLLLAAGTMTDTNGTTNFTQQFAVNGQRGVEAVFAMDGADSSDPEMGGATFSNFNVDAVKEIQSSSGWMPAEIGRGAAGFTDSSTRSARMNCTGRCSSSCAIQAWTRGTSSTARRRKTGAHPAVPAERVRVYTGRAAGARRTARRHKTTFFVEYQGFRQVLGTTQVMPVPTAAERKGIDTTAFPGTRCMCPLTRSWPAF